MAAPRCRVASFRLKRYADNPPGGFWTVDSGLFKREERLEMDMRSTAATMAFLYVKWVRVA